MKNLIAMACLLLILLGCATAYQSVGATGGYSETQLDRNIFRVSFMGNGYTRPERAADFLLLRSAELTLEKGFFYFVVVDEKKDTSYAMYTSGNATNIISKPGLSNTIVCFVDKPENVFAYDARFIYKTVSEKYGIRQESYLLAPYFDKP